MIDTAAEFLDDHSCIVGAMRRAIHKLGGSEPASIDFRRDSTGPADLVLLLPSALNPSGQSATEQFLRDLAVADVVASSRVRRNKISIRFADRFVAHLERCRAEHGLLDAGRRTAAAGRAAIVDFCDPNANKALHIGHLRNVALGHALASLWSAAGAKVTTQSVVCDFGRNIAEAIVGYRRLCPAESRLPTGKSDQFVGRCYATYASTIATATTDVLNAPISRETTARDDEADRLMLDWMAGDPQTKILADRLVRWSLEGHQTTFDRLGIRFDRLVLESECLPDIESVLQRARERGSLATTADGAIVFLTNRNDYPHLLLMRPDGFPTEHMRATVLWDTLRKYVNACDVCIHVMGNEWLASTDLRETLLLRLGPWPHGNVYRKVSHGMVLVGNSKMKSSDGEAVLADDVCDAILEHPVVQNIRSTAYNRLSDAEVLRLVIFSRFLAERAEDDIGFSLVDLFDAARNPGMTILAAISRSGLEQAPESDFISDDARFAILQGERLSSFFDSMLLNEKTVHMARQISRLAAWCLQPDRDPRASRAAQRFVIEGSRIIGLID